MATKKKIENVGGKIQALRMKIDRQEEFLAKLEDLEPYIGDCVGEENAHNKYFYDSLMLDAETRLKALGREYVKLTK